MKIFLQLQILDNDFGFELCNIGYGPALNIYIDPVELDNSVSFKFNDKISLLNCGDCIFIQNQDYTLNTVLERVPAKSGN